jgi:hypothetical protein
MPKTNGETFAFADEPTPEIKQPQKDAAQRLLTWLPRWPRDTITVRQIRVYGPKCLKGRMDAINAAEVLVANGWLTSTKAQRPDTYAWKILRKNSLNPIVGM